MPDFNISKIDSSASYEDPSSISSTPSASKSSSEDKIIGSSADSNKIYSTGSLRSERAAPQLPSPNTPEISFAYFLEMIGQAAQGLRQQLQASERADIYHNIKRLKVIAQQVMSVKELEANRSAAFSEIDILTEQQVAEGMTILNAMRVEFENQKAVIEEFNAGYAEEKQAYQDLLTATNKFYADLESIGVTKNSDGHYYIPPDKIDEYNAIALEYQAAIEEFNAYYEVRIEEINAYNEAAAQYNERLEQLEIQFIVFQQTYGIDIEFKVPYAELRDTSFYVIPLDSPYVFDPLPPEGYGFTIEIPPMPEYVIEYGQWGPPQVDDFSSFYFPEASFLEHALEVGLYHANYENHVAIYDNLIETSVDRWAFWLAMEEKTKGNALEEPIMNEKPLLALLFPGEQEIKRSLMEKNFERIQETKKKELIDQWVDRDSKKVLGHEILKEVIAEANLNLPPEQIEKLANQLNVLSLGLLNEMNLQSIFPSLSLIGNTLATLPKDSPAFALLFALSLTNRVDEYVKNGLTHTALNNLLEKIPELASLPDELKLKIETALNTGLLLMTGKLLEESLGLPGLLAQILTIAAPSAKIEQRFVQVKEKLAANEPGQKIEYKEKLISNGYPEAEADFLSEMSLEVLKAGGRLVPSAPFVSPQIVNYPFMLNSLKAALILSKDRIPLDKADIIAQQALENVFTDYHKPVPLKQFRSDLDNNLQELGLGKNSREIASEVIVLLMEEEGLALKQPKAFSEKLSSPPQNENTIPTPITSVDAVPSPEIPPIAASTRENIQPSMSPRVNLEEVPIAEPAPPSPTPIATEPQNAPSSEATSTPPPPQAVLASSLENQVRDVIKKRVNQLLVPQLGPQLSKEILDEINVTLFGTPHPDAKIKNQTKTPYSFIRILEDQIQNVNFEKDQAYGERIAEAFDATLETSVDLSAFLAKIMNPAYLLLYSSQTGIIYSSNTKERQLII